MRCTVTQNFDVSLAIQKLRAEKNILLFFTSVSRVWVTCAQLVGLPVRNCLATIWWMHLWVITRSPHSYIGLICRLSTPFIVGNIWYDQALKLTVHRSGLLQ